MGTFSEDKVFVMNVDGLKQEDQKQAVSLRKSTEK